MEVYKEDQKYTIFDLPVEVLYKVFNSIELKDILALSQSCLYFNRLFKSENFWEKLYKMHFRKSYDELPFINDESLSWKFKFIRTNMIHENWINGKMKKISISPYIYLPIKKIKITKEDVVYSSGCLLNFMDIDSMKFSFIFRKQSKNNIIFDYDDGILFYIDGNDNNRLYSYKKNEKIPKKVCTLSRSVTQIAYGGKSNVLVTGGSSIELRDPESVKYPLFQIQNLNGTVSQLIKKDDYLMTCMRGRTIRIYDIRSKSKICSLRGHTGMIRRISTNGEILSSSSRDGTIRIWDFRNSTECMRILNGTYNTPALSIDQWKLVSGSKNGDLSIWDMKDWNQFYRINIKKPIYSLEMNPLHLYIGSNVLNVYDYSKIIKREESGCKIS